MSWPGWAPDPRVVVAWYREWDALWCGPRWQLAAWSLIISWGLSRHSRTLWGWWVDRYVEVVVVRSRIRSRIDAIGEGRL